MTPGGNRWRLEVPANRWDLVPARGPQPVSVIICYYEAPEDLRRLIASLDAQTLPPHQIVVADDGSTEAPAKDVLRDRPDVLCVSQPDRGFRAGAARNLGAAAATGDVMVFLDADVVAAPSCLRHLAALPSTQPQSLTVGRRLHARLDGMAPDQAAALARKPHSRPDRLLPAPRWLEEGYAATADLSRIDVRSWRYVISAVMAMDRDYFSAVGGFEERLVGYGGEDWELAHRVLHDGGLLAHESRAVVVHNGPDLSGRPDALRLKDLETMRLFARITDRTFRPQAVRFATPRVLATVHADQWSPESLLTTVDSLLACQPDTAVQIRGWPELPAVLSHDKRIIASPAEIDHAHAEVGVDVHQPVVFDPAFNRAMALVDPGGCGWVSVMVNQRPAVTVTGLWAKRRCDRIEPAGAAAVRRARAVIGRTSLPPEQAGVMPVPTDTTLEALFDRGRGAP